MGDRRGGAGADQSVGGRFRITARQSRLPLPPLKKGPAFAERTWGICCCCCLNRHRRRSIQAKANPPSPLFQRGNCFGAR
ncbi:hypothetical protein [Lysobacter gummosus]|uniref:hypothetical protein n=1 Tax=Lysobacter gummosus TaxID=262324 RepID=UPI003628DA4C